MPPEAFLMTGGAAPFRPARACPVSGGPHEGGSGDGSWMVADAAVADGTAVVRVALWRCRMCGTLLAGIGRPSADLGDGPGTGVHVQEFTWLEGTEAVILGSPARAAPAAAGAGGDQEGG